MSVGTRLTNTFEELLPKLLNQLTQMKMAENAEQHLDWIIGIETQILEKIKQPFQEAAQMTAGPQPPSMMGPGAPVDPSMAMAAGMGQMEPPMSRGPMPGPTNRAPAVDEIRRMLNQGG